MKLTKFGILVNKTTSLFTSIRDSKISGGCGKILEIPEWKGGLILGADFGKSRGEGGHMANLFRGGGGVWIFSGTTHYYLQLVRPSHSFDSWPHRNCWQFCLHN